MSGPTASPTHGPLTGRRVRPIGHRWPPGIGPGCTGEDGSGGFTGQAIPPVRIKEVCEALNTGDEIRCCMESVCDTDFSGALQCLAGLVAETFPPVG